MRSPANDSLPRAAKRELKKLGDDIALARRKRYISTTSMAQRMHVSRSTLSKVESGDPTVSMGIYATALFILGLSKGLGNLADRKIDELGLNLDETRLPKKIHARKPRKLDQKWTTQ